MENYINENFRKHPYIKEHLIKLLNNDENFNQEDLEIFAESFFKYKNYIKQSKINITKIQSLESINDALYNIITEGRIKNFIAQNTSNKNRHLIDRKAEGMMKSAMNDGVSLNEIEKMLFKKIARYNSTKQIHDVIKKIHNNHIISSVDLIEKNAAKLDYENATVYKNDKILVMDIKRFESAKRLGSQAWCISTSKYQFESYLDRSIKKLATNGSVFEKVQKLYPDLVLEPKNIQLFIWNTDRDDKFNLIGYTLDKEGKIIASYDKHDDECTKDITEFVPNEVLQDYLKNKVMNKPYNDLLKVLKKDTEINSVLKGFMLSRLNFDKFWNDKRNVFNLTEDNYKKIIYENIRKEKNINELKRFLSIALNEFNMEPKDLFNITMDKIDSFNQISNKHISRIESNKINSNNINEITELYDLFNNHNWSDKKDIFTYKLYYKILFGHGYVNFYNSEYLDDIIKIIQENNEKINNKDTNETRIMKDVKRMLTYIVNNNDVESYEKIIQSGISEEIINGQSFVKNIITRESRVEFLNLPEMVKHNSNTNLLMTITEMSNKDKQQILHNYPTILDLNEKQHKEKDKFFQKCLHDYAKDKNFYNWMKNTETVETIFEKVAEIEIMSILKHKKTMYNYNPDIENKLIKTMEKLYPGLEVFSNKKTHKQKNML